MLSEIFSYYRIVGVCNKNMYITFFLRARNLGIKCQDFDIFNLYPALPYTQM